MIVTDKPTDSKDRLIFALDVPDVKSAELHAPWVVDGPAFALAERKQVRVHQRDDLLALLTAVDEEELHVDGVAVAYRDSRLQPDKFHLPGFAERVGTGLEFTMIPRHGTSILTHSAAVPPGNGAFRTILKTKA